uniref:Uncharacterized protein n=1 Tax=Xiphophorus couchianus TaxID=32473 RepID=A0A3B5M3N0_9TELE
MLVIYVQWFLLFLVVVLGLLCFPYMSMCIFCVLSDQISLSLCCQWQCFLLTNQLSNSLHRSEHNSKGCITSELCISFSVSYGAYRIVQNSKCCSEDLCNAQINYTKLVSTPNRKKCYSCDEENCMKTLKCAGDENYCIDIKVGVTLMSKGCASKLVCSDQFSSVIMYNYIFVFIKNYAYINLNNFLISYWLNVSLRRNAVISSVWR